MLRWYCLWRLKESIQLGHRFTLINIDNQSRRTDTHLERTRKAEIHAQQRQCHKSDDRSRKKYLLFLSFSTPLALYSLCRCEALLFLCPAQTIFTLFFEKKIEVVRQCCPVAQENTHTISLPFSWHWPGIGPTLFASYSAQQIVRTTAMNYSKRNSPFDTFLCLGPFLGFLWPLFRPFAASYFTAYSVSVLAIDVRSVVMCHQV